MKMENYYKTELHAHSRPASSCSEVEAKKLAELYKEKGYTSVVLTNHFIHCADVPQDKVKTYLEDYYICREEGERLGLNIILGAELRFTENINDYLIFGICPEELCDIYKLLPYGIDNFYKEYKNDKNIIIQAHPFRDHMESVNPKSLDGIEVFNMHPNHNSRIGFAARHAGENNLIATCGTDFHHLGHEGLCGILTESALKDSYEVARVLKNKEYKMCIGNIIIEP